MKPLRAHDYLPPVQNTKPDFRGLKVIMAGFAITTIACLGICIALIAHRPTRAAAHPAQCRCRCTGHV